MLLRLESSLKNELPRRGLMRRAFQVGECAVHLSEEGVRRARGALRHTAAVGFAFRRMPMHQLLHYRSRCLTRLWQQRGPSAQQRAVLSSLELLTLQVPAPTRPRSGMLSPYAALWPRASRPP